MTTITLAEGCAHQPRLSGSLPVLTKAISGADRLLPRQVTTYLGDEISPTLDPTGQRLVYVSNQGGDRELWSRSLQGGVPVRLAPHSADDFDPAFSPDGKRIAFASHRFDAKGDIFIMNADGSSIARLTDRQSADRQPAWFPDGQRLAFTSRRGHISEAIYQWDLKTQQATQLSQRPGFDPAVSPDGRFLVFSSPQERGSSALVCLWLHRLDDGAEQQLDACDRPEGFATWAKDGNSQWVVFSRFQDDTNQDGRIDLGDRPSLWKLRLDGWSQTKPTVSEMIPLTSGISADITPCVFGERIYYASRIEEELDIWSVPLSGSTKVVKNITDARARTAGSADPLDGIFILRRCALDLSGQEDAERCTLDQADLLLETGRATEAKGVYQILTDHARLEGVRQQSQLGQITARLMEEIPVGLSPSGQQERRLVAEELLQSLTPIQVSQSDKEVVRADILRRVGRWDEALDALDRPLGENPKNSRIGARARLLRSEIWRVLGNEQGALADYLEVLQHHPSQLREVQQAAQHLVELAQLGDLPGIPGNPLEKLQSVSQIYSNLPVLPELAQSAVGAIQRKAKRLDLAREAFRAVEGSDRAQAQLVARALLNLSEIAEEEGDISAGLDHVNEIIERFPNHPQLLRQAQIRIQRLAGGHAEALARKGELGMALKAYRQLIEQNPDDLHAHRRWIALMAAAGRAEEALGLYRQLQDQKQGSDLALYLMGLVLTYVEPPKHFSEAKKYIQSALTVNPQLLFAHQTMGWIYEQEKRLLDEEGSLEKAAESYQSALNLLDSRTQPRAEADLLFNLGNVQYTLGNARQAFNYFKRRDATSIPFDLPAQALVFWEHFARSSFLCGELEDALRGLAQAIVLAREQDRAKWVPRLVASQGAVYQLQGLHAKAVESFAEACRLYQQQGMKEHLASCQRNVAFNLYQQGMRKASAKAFVEAEDLLKRFGTIKLSSDTGVLVGLGMRASEAAYGFDQRGEMRFITTYQGRLFAEAGDLERAKEALERNISVLRQAVAASGGKGETLNLAVALNQLGALHFQSGDIDGAASLFEESTRLAREVKHWEGVLTNELNQLELIQSGCVTLDLPRLIETLQADRQRFTDPTVPEPVRIRINNLLSVALIEYTRRTMGAGTSRTGQPLEIVGQALASLDAARGRISEAESYLREACQQARKLQTRDGAKAAVFVCANWSEILWTLGRDAEAQGVRAEAHQLIEDLALLEIGWRIEQPGVSRTDQAEAALRLPGIVAGTAIHNGAARDLDRLLRDRVAEALDRQDVAAAFAWAERLYLRRRADAVDVGDVVASPDSDQAVRAGLQQRQDKLQMALRMLQPTLAAAEKDSARKEIFSALSQYLQFRDESAANPSSSRMFRPLLSRNSESADVLRARLDEGEGLLLVLPLEDRLVVFLLTRSGLSANEVSVALDEARVAMDEFWSSDAKKANAARLQLSDWIIRPIQAALAPLTSVIAVTDDLSLPLEVLRYRGKSLGRKIPVTHLYSASDLPMLRDKRNLNLERPLWIGESPKPDLVSWLNTHWNGWRHASSGNVGWLDMLRDAGLVVFNLGMVVDRNRPLRTALDPDSVLGSLGGTSLATLASRSSKSALWVLYNLPAGRQVDRLWAGLEYAMELGAVPTAIVIPKSLQSEPITRLLLRTLELVKTLSPAQAYSRAMDEALQGPLHWRDLLGVQLRGDPGMNEATRKTFAEQSLGASVQKAMEAFGAKRWSESLTAFLNVRELALYLKRQDLLPRVNQGLVQSAFQLGEIDLAVRFEREILEQALAVNDRTSAARARQFLGVLESRAGRHQKAVEQLKQAITEFDALKLPAESAQAFSTLGLAYDAAAEYESALQAAQEALRRYQSLGDRNQSLRMLRSIGTTYLKRQNLTGTARTWFSQALELARQLKDEKQVGAVLLDLARCETASGSYEASLRLITEAAELGKKLGDARSQAEAFLERAQAFWYLGDYQRARSAQQQALYFAEAAKEVRTIIIAHNLAGLIALNLGELEAAEKELQQALGEAQRAGLREEAAAQLNNLGTVAREKGDFSLALDRFNQALAIDTELKNVLGKAYDLRNMGLTEQMAGRLDAAQAHLLEALVLSQSVHDRFNEVKALLGLAQLSLTLDRRPQALDHALQAYERSVRIGLKDVSWRALRTIGEVARRDGQLPKAAENFRKAIQIVEELRVAQKAEEFRGGYLDNKYDLYEDMIHTLLDMRREEEAFSYAERARGRGFLDLLANRSMNIGGEYDQQLLSQIRTRETEVARLTEELSQAQEPRKGELKQAVEQARAAYQAALEELRKRQPDLSDFVEVRPISIQDVSAMLPVRVAVVAYYVTRIDTIAWVIRNDHSSCHRLPLSRSELSRQVTLARRLIENFTPADRELAELYQALVKPLSGELEQAQRVGVLTHDVLNYLPLSALRNGGSYWSEQVGLFVSPSAGVLDLLVRRQQGRMGPAGALLALGNPDLKDTKLDLPFAEKEAQAVGFESPGSEVYLREQASKALLMQRASSSEIIHLACHGTFDPDSPLTSSLRLASADGQDGTLTAIEVFSLALTAKLVTLSGCQTGLGKLGRGNEIVSFNRAFLTAGAGGVLSSLWRVSDLATAVMMKRFYRSLRQEPPVEALRKAQQLVRQYFPNPAYWASFVLVGTWQ